MKLLYTYSLLILFFLINSQGSRAQVTQGDFEGTDFWVAFMKNYSGSGVTRTLTFTARSASTVTLKTPRIPGAGSLNQTVTVPANGIVSVNINDSYGGQNIENNPANSIKPVGIHITATTPVTVYGYSIYSTINPDSWINIPTQNLGTNYLVIGLDAWGSNASRATIVATENNTNVTFTVPPNVTLSSPSAPAGTTFSKTLNQGDVYTIEGEGSGLDVSITGVKIVADKKIGVYNGSGDLVGPCTYWADNYGVEMALPTSTWGKEYVLKEFNSVSNACPGGPVTSYARIISSSPTPITITITLSTGVTMTQTLNYEGAFYDWGVIGPAVITAPSNCIAVVEMFTVNTTFTNILPVEQWGVGNISTTNPAAFTGASDNKAIIVQKSTGGTGKVWLDGVLQTGFTRIGTTNYYYKDLTFATGLRKFSGDSSYIVYPYGDQGAAGVKTYCNPASGGKLANIAVPLDLISFQARYAHGEVMLEWNATSKNTDHFVVERSLNGTDFRSVGIVKASTGSNEIRKYQYPDLTSIDSRIYYRLKSVDTEGKITFSSIAAINSGAQKTLVRISPQPVTSSANIELNSETEGLAELSVLSPDGKVLRNVKISLQPGINNQIMEFSEFSPGCYFLRITGSDNTPQYFRIIKE